jgi:4-dimethylallyltryptophan N-methyltransferase
LFQHIRSLDKIILLLDALEEQKKKVTYYALDLSYSEPEATLRTLPLQKYQHVECAALHGTFDDGLEWIRNGPEVKNRPHCAMFLGSTIGDFSMTNSAEFVRNMAISALSGRPHDSSILISFDSCKLPTKILRAYTSDGVIPFALAGLQYVSTIVRQTSGSETPITDIFQTEDWYYLSEYSHLLGCHEAYYTPRNRAIRLGAPLDYIVVQEARRSGLAIATSTMKKNGMRFLAMLELQLGILGLPPAAT